MFFLKLLSWNKKENFYDFAYNCIGEIFNIEFDPHPFLKLSLSNQEADLINKELNSFSILIFIFIVMEIERKGLYILSAKMKVTIIEYIYNKNKNKLKKVENNYNTWQHIGNMFHEYVVALYDKNVIDNSETDVYYFLCDKFSNEMSQNYLDDVKHKSIMKLTYDYAFKIWNKIKLITYSYLKENEIEFPT